MNDPVPVDETEISDGLVISEEEFIGLCRRKALHPLFEHAYRTTLGISLIAAAMGIAMDNHKKRHNTIIGAAFLAVLVFGLGALAFFQFSHPEPRPVSDTIFIAMALASAFLLFLRNNSPNEVGAYEYGKFTEARKKLSALCSRLNLNLKELEALREVSDKTVKDYATPILAGDARKVAEAESDENAAGQGAKVPITLKISTAFKWVAFENEFNLCSVFGLAGDKETYIEQARREVQGQQQQKKA